MSRATGSGAPEECGAVWFQWPDMKRRLQRPSLPPAAFPPVQNPWTGPPTSLLAVQEAHNSFEQALQAAFDAAAGHDLDEVDVSTSDLVQQDKNLLVQQIVHQVLQRPEQLLGVEEQPFEGGGAAPPAAAQAPGDEPCPLAVPRALLHSWQEGAAAGRSSSAAKWVVPLLPPTADAGQAGQQRRCVAPDELLVTVVVCRPRREFSSVLMEVQVLGSNLLSELKDAICCWMDGLAASAGVHTPSAYFYINSTIYSDLRQPGAEPATDAARTAWSHHHQHPPDDVCITRLRLHQFRGAGAPAAEAMTPVPAPDPAAVGSAGPDDAAAAAAPPAAAPAAPPPPAAAAAAPPPPPPAHGAATEYVAATAAAAARAVAPEAAPAQPVPSPSPAAPSPAAAAGPADGMPTMAGTRVRDVRWSISNRCTYVYCHQGVCEHGWYVSDIRRVTPSDPQLVSQYPWVTHVSKLPERSWLCGVCRQVNAHAVKVILNHPEAPSDVVLACPTCSDLLVPPNQPLPAHLEGHDIQVHDVSDLQPTARQPAPAPPPPPPPAADGP